MPMSTSVTSEQDLAMINEPIARLFWRYSIPTIASMLVTGIYVTIDGMFIGHYLGEQGLAGMMLAYPVASILYAVGALIGMGSAALVSIYLGRNNVIQARRLVGNAFSLCLLFGLFFAIVGCWSSSYILQWLGATGEVLKSAEQYLFWYFALGTWPILSMAFSALLRNDGRPQAVTWILILGGVLNVIFDYLWIVVWPYGLTGAAIATMLAQAITAAFYLHHFFWGKTRLSITWQQMRLTVSNCLEIFKMGLPSFLMNLYLSIVLTLHNMAFMWVGGPIHVAAYAVVSYTEALFYLIFEGIALGCQPILSFNAGARRFERVFATFKYAVVATLLVAFIAVTFIYIKPEWLVYLFAGDNPALTPVAVNGMLLYFWGLPMEGLLLVGASFLQAIGLSKQASTITGAKLILIALTLYLFAWLFGLTGVWISLAVCSCILLVWLVFLLKRVSVSHSIK